MHSKNLPLDDTNDITLNQSYTASKSNSLKVLVQKTKRHTNKIV